MQRILMRAEGYQKIGTGHIMRCLALADMLPEYNIEFAFQNRDSNLAKIVESKYVLHKLPTTDNYYQDLENFLEIVTQHDIVVLDGYMFSEGYQNAMVTKAKNVVIIDDLNNGVYNCDFLINHAYSFKASDYKFKKSRTKAYVGSPYSLIRKPFLNCAQKPFIPINRIDNILICLGGADPENYSLKIAQTLRKLTSMPITIIIGPSNPHRNSFKTLVDIDVLQNLSAKEMLDNYLKHSLLILTGSGVVLEAFSARRPIALFAYADNQIPVIKTWHDLECIQSLGDLRTLTEEKLTENLRGIIYLDNNVITQMQKRQASLMDGLADKRIKKLFEALNDNT